MRPSYSYRDVRFHLEGYEELKAIRDTKPGLPLSLLCSLADVHAAVEHLNPALRGTVLLVAQMGYTMREAAQMLDVSLATVFARYERAREEIVTYLNGDYE